MNGRVFLDTNVLVYLYDASEPQKQAKARALLAGLGRAEGDHPIISTQVLQEFYVTVSRKLARSLPEGEVLLAMRSLRSFPTVQVDVAMIFEAIDLCQKFRLSFWDALIAQAAISAGCSRMLTEDLQHQMWIGDLMVENPFLEA